MSILPSARAVNVVFAVILSFIAGYAASANAEAVTQTAGKVCKWCFTHPAAAEAGEEGCCQKLNAKNPQRNQRCGCAACEGACGGGKGKCSCDPLTCMDAGGCNAWCPGK